jgi:hypothetical protein
MYCIYYVQFVSQINESSRRWESSLGSLMGDDVEYWCIYYDANWYCKQTFYSNTGSNCHEVEREMYDSFYIVSSLGTALRAGRWHMNNNQNSAKMSYLTWKGNTWDNSLIHTSVCTLYFDCNYGCQFRKWDIQLCFPTLWNIESEESSLNILIRYRT